MFSIIFFSYSYLGDLLFGSQIKNYRSVTLSVYTMFRTMLGDFDLSPIEHADRTFGPLYLMGYIFFVFFVLLNVFLAIINDTYGGVKERVMSMKPAFQLGDFFMVGVNNVKNAAGIQVTIQIKNDNNLGTYCTVVSTLMLLSIYFSVSSSFNLS